MMNDIRLGVASDRDVSGAVICFIDELKRGPFAPALAGEMLSRFGIEERLADFVKTYLNDQAMLISNKNLSPVNRPALSLVSRLADPEYWKSYRLSSLYRIWSEAVIDMSVLARPVNQARLFDGGVSFVKTFQAGLKIHGTISRRAYSGAGLIVDVDVSDIHHSCFLPIDSLSLEDRLHVDSLVGRSGEFEIVSVLAERKSVLVRLVKLADSGKAQKVFDTAKETSADHIASVEKLHRAGFLTDEEFRTVCLRILKA